MEQSNVFLEHEKSFTDNLQNLATPIPVVFTSTIPTIEEIANYLGNQDSKILCIVDDFSSKAFESKDLAEVRFLRFICTW